MIFLIREDVGGFFYVTPNDVFYHGTIESFDYRKLRTGGDGVLWTSKDKNIAKTYIPDSTGEWFLNSESIANPSKDPSIIDFQKLIGIHYDLKTAEFNNAGRAISYYTAPVFKKISDEFYKISKELSIVEDEIKKYNNKMKNVSDDDEDGFKEIYKEYLKLEKKQEELLKQYRSKNPEKIKNKYVNYHLEKLGYKPKDNSDYNNNFYWKLKIKKNKIMPADYQSQGRLLEITPKKILKFYDMAGDVEPDLQDRQYNELSFFQKLEKMGYDGVKINDHAQHNKWGNVPHKSWGFFKKTIPFLDVKVIDNKATHPEDL